RSGLAGRAGWFCARSLEQASRELPQLELDGVRLFAAPGVLEETGVQQRLPQLGVLLEGAREELVVPDSTCGRFTARREYSTPSRSSTRATRPLENTVFMMSKRRPCSSTVPRMVPVGPLMAKSIARLSGRAPNWR